MQKLRSIQALRAVAACAVVVYHTYDRGGNAAYGGVGVDLFFVISGFIMAKVAPATTAVKFAQDRLWRIYPLRWLAVLPWILLVPGDLLSVISSLTLWLIYGGYYVLPTLRVGSTLSLELLFYAGMMLAIATRLVVPLALYSMFLTGALTTSLDVLHFVGSPMALEFLMGVVVARLPRQPAFGVLILLGLGLLSMTPTDFADLDLSLEPQFALWRALQWGLPAALIVWGALSMESVFEHRLFNVPVAIGDASYSIYLFHALISYGLNFFWPVRLLPAIAVGLAIHVLVERRIMAARKRTAICQPPDTPIGFDVSLLGQPGRTGA